MTMIALIPAQADAERLALSGNGATPADQLHVTLAYLGDDDGLTDDDRAAIASIAEDVAADWSDEPIEATIAGIGTLGDEDPPATILLLNGPTLDEIHSRVLERIDTHPTRFREQHRPWIAHMTLAYTNEIDADVKPEGSIIFDAVRFQIDNGGESQDHPLAESREDEAVTANIGGKEGEGMGTKFRALLAPINKSTGDGRRFAEGSITHAPLPFPFEWAREKGMGHDGSVTIGRVTKVDMSDTEMWGSGELFDDVDPEEMPRLAEDVAEAKKLISEGVIGPSVDLDEFEGIPVKAGTNEPIDFDELEETDPMLEDTEIELLVTEGRVRAATLVSIPAFVETSQPIELDDDEEEDREGMPALVASVIGSIDLPVADRGHDWDGAAAARRVFDLCTDGDTVDTDCVSRAFLWRDTEADGETMGAYSLGFADVIDGQLRIVPQGIAAAAGGRGVDATDIPAEDKDRVKSRICSIYDHIRNSIEDWPECPFASDDSADTEASIQAVIASVAAPSKPDITLLDRPDFTGPTPFTVDFDNGRVFGHIAPREACHAGFADRCVRPPMTGDYSAFHRYPVETSDGVVWAGRLSAGGFHPGLDKSMIAAINDYDSKTTVAHVRAGEDEFGIWISGVLEPDLDDTAKSILSRRKVSGDWRSNETGLTMVDVLALPDGPPALSEPGFPVSMRVEHGVQKSLVACLGPFTESLTAGKTGMNEIREAVAQAFREDRARQAEASKLAAILAESNTAEHLRAREMLAAELGE